MNMWRPPRSSEEFPTNAQDAPQIPRLRLRARGIDVRENMRGQTLWGSGSAGRLDLPHNYTFYMFYMDNSSTSAAKMAAFPVSAPIDICDL